MSMRNSASPFSETTLQALVDVAWGSTRAGEKVGVNRTDLQLESLLQSCDFPFGLDWSGVDKNTLSAHVFEMNAQHPEPIHQLMIEVCSPRWYVGMPDVELKAVNYLNSRLEFDGFVLRRVGREYTLVRTEHQSPALSTLEEKLRHLGFTAVLEELERARGKAATEPSAAVASACALLESLFKHLLDEMRVDIPARKDIKPLAGAVSEQLNLNPSRKDLPPDAEQDIRQMLQGLQTLVAGIGSLRTHASVAHGREKGEFEVDPRTARLAINSAFALALFYVESWEKDYRTQDSN